MIRAATLDDVTQTFELLKSFATASLVNYSDWSDADAIGAIVILKHLIANGYLMVAEHDGKIVGMIGAMVEQDPWISSKKRMRELFWWVEPEFRRSRISAELFVKWQADCERFIRDKLVDTVSLSTQPGSSDIDLSKRGWRCVESHWIKE